MDAGTTLRWAAERYPDRRAVGGTKPRSFGEWDVHTDRLAARVAALGVAPGDRVVLLLEGGEPLASLHLALQKLGATSVPLSTRFGPEELAYCVGDSSPRLLVSDTAHGQRASAVLSGLDVGWAHAGSPADAPHGAIPLDRVTEEASPNLPVVSEDAVSVMLYTSGTTGRPKGVPRTHRAEHAAATAHVIQTQQRPREVVLGVMPMFHTMGLRTLLASIVVGGTWVPMARFDVERALELILGERVSSLYLVPTMYRSLLQSGRLGEASSLRRLAYAGAPMTPTLAEQLTETLAPELLVNHFGSTEIYTFTVSTDGITKPGCAGRAGVFSRIRLVAPEPEAPPDALVGPGEQGQVIASLTSPEAFSGYWQRPDADAKAIRDGWYYTGDLATTDSGGDLWISGRVDDMINSGGENIYPDEIEATLARCPAIADVVVAGLPDERWGQAVTAFAVPRSGVGANAALDELAAYARAKLPGLKRPKRYLAVAEVPKSAVGKILRRQLRDGEYEAMAERP